MNLGTQHLAGQPLQAGDVPIHRFQISVRVGYPVVVEHHQPLGFQPVWIRQVRLVFHEEATAIPAMSEKMFLGKDCPVAARRSA